MTDTINVVTAEEEPAAPDEQGVAEQLGPGRTFRPVLSRRSRSRCAVGAIRAVISPATASSTTSFLLPRSCNTRSRPARLGGRHAGPPRRPAGSARRRLSLGRGARRRVKRTRVQMAGTAGNCKVLAATL
jgi:hypothetical protein